MAGDIYKWSTTAANNATADGDINWAEGMLSSAVNDSARTMMKRVAEIVGDTTGTLTAGGTANALTVTANGAFTTYADGRPVSLKIASDNTGAATLNVNSIGAKSIRKMLPSGESALTGGELQATGVYAFLYQAALNAAAGGWLVLNPTNVIPVPRTNYLINGNFEIAQRGTSFTTTSLNGGYTLDRWITAYVSGSGLTTTQQAFTVGQTDVPGEPKNFIRLVSTGTTGSTQLYQRVESVRTLAGKTCTLTFYGRISSGTLAFTPFITQDFGSGGSTGVQTNGTAGTLTTTFQKFTSVITMPSISGKTIGTNDFLTVVPYSVAAAARTVEFAHLSLVEGDASGDVDAFTVRPIQQELALCQRRYWTGFAQAGGTNLSASGMLTQVWVAFPVTMAGTPTLSNTNQVLSSASTITTDNAQPGGCRLLVQSTSALTNFSGGCIIIAEAEL